MLMQIPTVIECVKGNVIFLKYQDGLLWYSCLSNGFTFPVPTADAEGGTFLAEDKALYFMRWIRRHIEELRSENI